MSVLLNPMERIIYMYVFISFFLFFFLSFSFLRTAFLHRIHFGIGNTHTSPGLCSGESGRSASHSMHSNTFIRLCFDTDEPIRKVKDNLCNPIAKSLQRRGEDEGDCGTIDDDEEDSNPSGIIATARIEKEETQNNRDVECNE